MALKQLANCYPCQSCLNRQNLGGEALDERPNRNRLSKGKSMVSEEEFNSRFTVDSCDSLTRDFSYRILLKILQRLVEIGSFEKIHVRTKKEKKEEDS